VSIVAFSLAVAVAAPAFAGTPKTQAACEKAGMKWDATAKKCSKGMWSVFATSISNETN
jgi:hypothetical protein